MAYVDSAAAPTVVPAVASRRTRDLLDGPLRESRVLHRGAHALYLELDGWCLGVVSASAVAVPCALAVARDHLGDLATATAATVGAGTLRLETTTGILDVRVGRLIDVSAPRLDRLPSGETVHGLRAAARLAVDELERAGTGPLVVRGRLETTSLLGRGSGLTPLGDDVVCGWTAAAYALRHELPTLEVDPRERTTLFSATLVDCARRGEVLPEFIDLVHALARQDPHAVAAAGTRLSRVGHTSGSGLLLGACLLFEELRSPHEGNLCA